MKKIVTFIYVLLAASMSIYAFDYRIVISLGDSTFNGGSVYLRDEADMIHLAEYVVSDGIVEFSGESDRTFPAMVFYRNDRMKSNGKPIRFIVEPGEISVNLNEATPPSGGILNEKLLYLFKLWREVDYRIDPSKMILRECFEKNIGNGLGEYALLAYSEYCSPEEWAQCLEMIDENTKNLTMISNITDRKERMKSVWEGQPFTELNGKTLDGNSACLSDYVGKGRYVVADLWASWCGGCISDGKTYIKPLYEEYKDNPNVMFLGIAMDNVDGAVKKHGFEWPQITECEKLMRTYAVYSIPEVIIFGPDGTILRRLQRGRDLKDLLKDLLSEKPKTCDFIGGQSLK